MIVYSCWPLDPSLRFDNLLDRIVGGHYLLYMLNSQRSQIGTAINLKYRDLKKNLLVFLFYCEFKNIIESAPAFDERSTEMPESTKYALRYNYSAPYPICSYIRLVRNKTEIKSQLKWNWSRIIGIIIWIVFISRIETNIFFEVFSQILVRFLQSLNRLIN